MSQRIGLFCFVFLVLASLAVLVHSAGDYAAQDRDSILAESTRQHIAGTDQLGRDRAVRCASALVLDLLAATAASIVTVGIAAAIGTVAAFSSPFAASALMLGSDLFLTLPWLFLLMIVRSGLSLTASPAQSAVLTFAILAVLGWPACARAIYRGALHLRHADPLVYGRAAGLRPSQLIRLHLLPQLRPLLFPHLLVSIPAFIIAEANLGTLGLGIAEPLPSWGALLLDTTNSALLARSHWLYLPAVLLGLLLLVLEALAGNSQTSTPKFPHLQTEAKELL